MVFVFCVNFPFVLLPQYLVVSAESRKATEGKNMSMEGTCGGGAGGRNNTVLKTRESLGDGDSRGHEVRAAHFSAL